MWLLSARSTRFVLERIIFSSSRNTIIREHNHHNNIMQCRLGKQKKFIPYTGRKRRSAISACAFTEPIYEVFQQLILNQTDCFCFPFLWAFYPASYQPINLHPRKVPLETCYPCTFIFGCEPKAASEFRLICLTI